MCKLSIVVTSHTRGRLGDILALLDSLADQTFRDFELVFVADHCEDLHGAVAAYAGRKGIRAKVILHRGERGVNVCRNAGVLAASGEIVGFVDDDTVLFPDWAEQSLEAYERAGVVAITGPALPLWDNPERMSWFPKALNFVWGCTVWDWEHERPIRNVGGMNCSFRRDVLLSAGLYRTGIGPIGGEEKIPWFHPSGEEVELSLRVRKTFGPSVIILYTPNVKIFHRVQRHRFNTRFLVKRCFRFGYTRNFIRKVAIDNRVSMDERVLRMEYEHLKSVWSAIFAAVRAMPRDPISQGRLLLTLMTGVIATAVGYLAYFVVPHSRHPNQPGIGT